MGAQWLNALSQIDYDNRCHAGAVTKIDIQRGKSHAKNAQP
jgi:hypothetical protein